MRSIRYVLLAGSLTLTAMAGAVLLLYENAPRRAALLPAVYTSPETKPARASGC